MAPRDDQPTRAALLAAMTEGRVDLAALGERLATHLGTPEEQDEAVTTEQRQFLNGLETLVLEGLRGEGRTTRDFVFDTAIPILVSEGRTTVDLVEGHTTLFVALGHELASAVPDDVRPDAAMWLAGFFGDYVREVAERALVAERERDGT